MTKEKHEQRLLFLTVLTQNFVDAIDDGIGLFQMREKQISSNFHNICKAKLDDFFKKVNSDISDEQLEKIAIQEYKDKHGQEKFDKLKKGQIDYIIKKRKDKHFKERCAVSDQISRNADFVSDSFKLNYLLGQKSKYIQDKFITKMDDLLKEFDLDVRILD